CLVFLPLSTRPPLTATLFPYTTLFRSAHRALAARRTGYRGGTRGARPDPARPTAARSAARRDRDARVSVRRRRSTRRAGGAGRRDRKSTRLNSSHEWISYAVFCLKKKI